ncbi:hypothetical protein VISI1226_15681 [Vibrio sinaloensis DSM 21326]|uniref:Uncharacterized protein n=1 Tax=Vibrio sinaloensis DSM 21326 TaxID=945550 RepID=E8MD19_PHOS4|nr:hypothetical protein VISI1226_15681 [Vibrio sinaloensis DSM 21326]
MRPSYLLLFIGLALPAYANLEQEVTRLIDNIEQSSCTFYRNGKAYSPLEAAEHIANKWDYAKDDVDNLDTFIREVASKSWFTGKPYMVECADKQLTSQEWLLELAHSSSAQ